MQCGAAAAALDSAASRAEGSVVWAKMNCNHHPDVVKRFGIRSFPHLVLFKDRQMFVYPSGGELAPDAFAAFVDAAGAVEEGLEVPPPASLTDELQELLQEWMEEAPLLVYAAFGLAALLVGAPLCPHPRDPLSHTPALRPSSDAQYPSPRAFAPTNTGATAWRHLHVAGLPARQVQQGGVTPCRRRRAAAATSSTAVHDTFTCRSHPGAAVSPSHNCSRNRIIEILRRLAHSPRRPHPHFSGDNRCPHMAGPIQAGNTATFNGLPPWRLTLFSAGSPVDAEPGEYGCR